MEPRFRVVLGVVSLAVLPFLSRVALGEETSPNEPEVGVAQVVEAVVARTLPAEPGSPTVPTPAEPDASAASKKDECCDGQGRIRWENHRTIIESPNAHLELSNRVQFRFIYENPDAQQRLSGTAAPGEGKGSFRIRRAKTTLEGWFWKPELEFELQLSWAGPEAGASTNTPLEDMILRWDASKKGTYELTVGQFKVPFGRQEMSTSSGLQFLDRSLLSFEFTRGRDIGVMVGGRVAGDKLEYRAGVFNGNSASQLSNANTKMQYDARVSFEPFGKVAYREGDLEGSAKPLVAIAAQFEHNDMREATNANDMLTVIGGGDVVVRYRGFSLFGEYFYRQRTPEEGAAFLSPGFNVQAGYFVVPKRLEVALRYAGFDPSDAVAGDDRREMGVAASYFIQGHNLKIQADFRQIEDKGTDRKNQELRLQTQFIF